MYVLKLSITRVMRSASGFKFNQPVSEQLQRPAGLAFGQCRAAQGQSQCFQAAINLQDVLARRGLAVQRHVQTLQNKFLLDALRLALTHGMAATSQVRGRSMRSPD